MNGIHKINIVTNHSATPTLDALQAWCSACQRTNDTTAIFGSLSCRVCRAEVEMPAMSSPTGNGPANMNMNMDDDDDEPREDDLDACMIEQDEVEDLGRSGVSSSPGGVEGRAVTRELSMAIAAAVQCLLGVTRPRERDTYVRDVVTAMRSQGVATAAVRARSAADSREVAAACLMTVVRKRIPAFAHALQTRMFAKVLGTTENAVRAIHENMPGVDYVFAADLAAQCERESATGDLSRDQRQRLGVVCRRLADDINHGRGSTGSKLSTRVRSAVEAALKEVGVKRACAPGIKRKAGA